MTGEARSLIRGDSLEAAILTTVAYFDIYACAPTAPEIHRFLVGYAATQSEVLAALEQSGPLLHRLGKRDGFYFLRGKQHLAPRRVRFLEHSRRLWPEAQRIAGLLERSGLCSSAMVTGSLAADNADEHADIDFLLTYPAHRTWTSYGLVRLAAKVPGLGLGNFCPNYALPEDRLEVRPQNLFTAWELAKAVPMFGYAVYRDMVADNTWVRRYLPNGFVAPAAGQASRRGPRWARRLTESAPFQALERAEKRRKFSADRSDVGVDMEAREREGSMDRHSPTRPFQALAELRYRMELYGLMEHPVYAELDAWVGGLRDEMVRWGDQPIEANVAGR